MVVPGMLESIAFATGWVKVYFPSLKLTVVFSFMKPRM